MAQKSAIRSRDVYANLLRDTRGLRRDQATARDAWFAAISVDRKEETLFELEMLLKGLACFGNARNHPGKQRQALAVAHDFHEELRIVREALDRAVGLVRALLGERDRAYSFSRYLETVLPEDSERSRLIKDQLTQDTPEEALFLLRNAFAGFVEIADGLLRLGRVSHRLYHALHGTIAREVGRNAYFNPLVALEFRAEFDRIRHPQVLEALSSVESESAHRVVALAFLTLFRALRYCAAIDQYAAEGGSARQAYVVLAALRSDLRALSRFLTQQASTVMADGFERELLSVPRTTLRSNRQAIVGAAGALVALRGALENVGSMLRVEVKKTFENDLPPPDEAVAAEQLAPQLVVGAAQIRAAIHDAIYALCGELRPDQDLPHLVSPDDARRAAGERLRRDVWMFMHILRAFLAKARAATGGTDTWSSFESFQFVREFLSHFRAIGSQLVRRSDYERLGEFMAALDALRDADLLDPARLESALAECDSFFHYLEQLFAQVSRRAELREVSFDKKAAVETLKVYLRAE